MGGHCTLSSNEVSANFEGVGDLVLQGIPNMAIVREAKSKLLIQMPGKLAEILQTTLQSTHDIPCDLFWTI